MADAIDSFGAEAGVILADPVTGKRTIIEPDPGEQPQKISGFEEEYGSTKTPDHRVLDTCTDHQLFLRLRVGL